jgi:5,10-methylenetetrahydromethanopterin reductase
MAFPWGVWFEPVQPVVRIVELARLAEREGAEVCFVADEGTDRDLYVTLTAVALGTEQMIVAPAITNPFSRHPVATAAAIATLAELVPGRVWHGLGVGGSRVLAPLDLTPERPYTALRDAFEVNRTLLSGGEVGSARLPWAKEPVPIVIAGRGPRVQALAAAEADWVILSAEAPSSLPAAAERLRANGCKVAWSAYLAYGPEQRERVLGHFSYMALDAPPAIRDRAGLTDELVDAIRTEMLAGRLDAAAALLPDALIDEYAVAGTPDECAQQIGALASSFDLFMLPMNDIEHAEEHIVASAGTLRRAQRANR